MHDIHYQPWNTIQCISNFIQTHSHRRALLVCHHHFTVKFNPVTGNFCFTTEHSDQSACIYTTSYIFSKNKNNNNKKQQVHLPFNHSKTHGPCQILPYWTIPKHVLMVYLSLENHHHLIPWIKSSAQMIHYNN